VTEWICDEPVNASDDGDRGGLVCGDYDDRHPEMTPSSDDPRQALASSYEATVS
jgi:hypothetical protein